MQKLSFQMALADSILCVSGDLPLKKDYKVCPYGQSQGIINSLNICLIV